MTEGIIVKRSEASIQKVELIECPRCEGEGRQPLEGNDVAEGVTISCSLCKGNKTVPAIDGEIIFWTGHDTG